MVPFQILRIQVLTVKGACERNEKYKELFELRIKFSSDISIIFYFTFQNNTFVLLNGFTKKSNKTPTNELDRAIKYKKDYESRCRDE